MNRSYPNFPSHVWNNFFEQSVGFDKLLSNIDNYYLNVDKKPSYPPYNIIRNSESSYQIVIALAGFSSKDITVSLNENILTVKGDVKADDNSDKYLIKGIASRKFEKLFSLNEYAIVDSVSFKNGVLDIKINIVLPEEKQPQTFNIEE
tara:strand:- start:170 stop:613 length:444 start_codon:yes stop_codon:yes gene_type:complete